jgi:arylsulfatase A-like enzyme
MHLRPSRWFLQRLACLLLLSFFFRTAGAAERPNILWITAEDMSPTLGCYGDRYATTPNLDQLASQSTRYSHAFATAPVCSPSRACLIHGVPATTQGTHPMRSLMPLPESMNGLPAVLRDAGYYTSNNVKTDYNTAAEPTIVEASWNASSPTAHWRGRSDGQPFFSVINLMTSHQSRTMVWPYQQFQTEVQNQLAADQVHSPDTAPVPPYYPDTPLVRKTIARYYDCVTAMDQQVGQILADLKADGLDDRTIVFFFSDHGSGMPRHKRALYDSGMRVPLMIRFPDAYQAFAPTDRGQWSDRLVCFADFLPTVLSLAGVDRLPEYVSGRPFLGPLATEPRRYVFGHRDRVDEILDKSRSVRSKNFLYIRNFMPHRGWNQQNAWCDQADVRGEFYALAESGQATAAQAQYLSPSRPREELYDCVGDPMNLDNLAGSPDHQATLQRMRRVLRRELLDSRDLGFVPEIELKQIAETEPPMTWVRSETANLSLPLRAADLVGTQRFDAIARTLRHDDPSVRYWGAVACTAADALPSRLKDALKECLSDGSVAVQIEAAGALVKHGRRSVGYAALEKIISDPASDPTELLYAARTVELLADPEPRGLMQSLYDRFEDAPGDMAWFIRFSTTGYLNRLPKQ